ncbi:SDR family NAD(P)-dependent oxidoreductase [Streptomyces parvulus]|uniref:SDR family NAD(P)-dependent oxidoreductase n=1 Tax=Streptomyces parvulus TaxID=146923 RepID=A0ABV5D7F4_9ACTN|nr:MULTISPECIES: SDR family NAD(P)-dependent oxidoreductase [Streptomyces]MCC9154779.1 SDR family NAD(P)-dependent oxidoreductase [Streptomyces parvulus]MCE7690636.1 SDR family NAD(P)-dependent oxidoreductase [Streptomyces parvulus]MZD57775.1 SDR family NAD(P)-dependent oxidoreductase [Streptomyces sp. SID5606]WHM34946.1 SDR family NAD(P)-dependent oxidoreductase [Streptomyces sp. BPPL-273]WML78412.1 SDR family NAD(P)-dependent oxidoreductase [Streptomyces sp. VNUA74]
MTVTLITGANKGLGFETARQLLALGHVVYVGARDAGRGEKAAAELGARFVRLDVTDDASVSGALAAIDAAEGRLDVLVHNAGILPTGTPDGPTALRAFDTNAVGVVRVTEAALPLLRRSSNPTVVTVSSSAGSFWAVNNPDRPEYSLPTTLYSASKAAATMLTVQYAKSEPGIRFNAVEPGFTATDMTAGFEGGRTPEESARTIVRLATLGPDGPTGTLQDENGELAW